VLIDHGAESETGTIHFIWVFLPQTTAYGNSVASNGGQSDTVDRYPRHRAAILSFTLKADGSAAAA
jgi:hypothetical protein